MRLKMKVVIFLVSVLLTIVSFNLIATFVYVNMVKVGKCAELEVIPSSMAKAGKELPHYAIHNKNH